MEERRACCGFWTIALPDVALQRLMELDAWPVFQSSIRRRLAVALRTRGVPAQVVGVVELHPKRTASFATDLPHLHVLFRGKRHRWQQWAMAPAEFDRIVWWALWDACCWDVPQLVGCQVEPVRKSVRRYLAKYLGKLGRNSGTERVDNSDVRLIPRQWHFSSGEVIESIRTLTLPIPPEFLTFLIDRRKANGPGQLFHAHQVEIPDPRAPVIWRIAWRSPWALFLCWEAYEKALRWGPKPSL
jgi:hypothetical protein